MRARFAILLLIPAALAAQEVRLSARPGADRYRIGEWVDVEVEGHAAAGVDTLLPALRDSLGPFEVLGAERVPNDLRWRLRFTTLDSGTVFLPPIPFAYRRHGDTTTQRAYSNSLSFRIAGMSIDTKGEIRDIKGPMSSPWTFEDLWPYLLGTVVLSAAIAGGYVYYRRWRLRKHDIVPQALPAIPAHKEALAALRALEEKKLWQQGKVKLFHSEATEIIRLFFERRWNVIALELTTEEILLHMRRFPEAVSVWQEMESFFHRADLVKFAKLIPTPEDCAGEMRIAYEIVRAMVPQEPQEPREETSVTEEAAHVR